MSTITQDSPNASAPAFLTIEETAALLRISRATAYALAHRGDLPAVRVGGQLRVDRAALLARYTATEPVREMA